MVELQFNVRIALNAIMAIGVDSTWYTMKNTNASNVTKPRSLKLTNANFAITVPKNKF